MNKPPDADTIAWRARMAAFTAEYDATHNIVPNKKVRIRRTSKPVGNVAEDKDQIAAKAIYEMNQVLREIGMINDGEYECAHIYEDFSNPELPRRWAEACPAPFIRDN